MARPAGKAGVVSSPSRDHERKQLERELCSPGYLELLCTLRTANVFYRQFSSWSDVIAFMRAGTSRDPRKDDILRPICQAHHRCPDPRWLTILLVIFWPGLQSIWSKMRSYDLDSLALWANITWTFTQVVYCLDPDRRPNRLVQKIYNDTIHHVRREYRAQEQRWKREVSIDSPELDEIAGEDSRMADLEERDERDAQIRWLNERRQAGLISEADCDLLVGTVIYGEPLAECAHRMGLNYEVAKKRRQRAEAKIAGYRKHHKIF